jgi:hypothetical protein
LSTLIFFFLLTQIHGYKSAENIKCESIVDGPERGFVGILKTCFMTSDTEISQLGVNISSQADSTVKAIDFNHNDKIVFLPESPSSIFPNLEAYFAYDCSIKTISASNFKGLSKLRRLALEENYIETINSDVFQDLISLETLNLCK